MRGAAVRDFEAEVATMAALIAGSEQELDMWDVVNLATEVYHAQDVSDIEAKRALQNDDPEHFGYFPKTGTDG